MTVVNGWSNLAKAAPDMYAKLMCFVYWALVCGPAVLGILALWRERCGARSPATGDP